MLKLTFAIHAAALALTLVDPSLWRWTLSAIVANHLLLLVLSLQPRGRLLGRNVSALPRAAVAGRHVAITIDDGPDPDVTPAVLDILDAHSATATFFCIGANVEAHPHIARDIVRRGHAIENHSARHPWHFALSGFGGLVREIEAAQRTIATITGWTPAFFRAPAGIRSPFLDMALRRQGLALVSWTRRGFDTVNRDPQQILSRLTEGLAAGDILLLHDGNAARAADGTPVILLVLPRLLEAIEAAGLRTVTLRTAIGAVEAKGGTTAAEAAAVSAR